MRNLLRRANVTRRCLFAVQRCSHVSNTSQLLSTSRSTTQVPTALVQPNNGNITKPEDVDIGELQTSPATKLQLKDLCGPWLILADTLQGELFIWEDNFVTLRPPPQGTESSTLVNGIGRIELFEEGTTAASGLPADTPNTVTLFRIELETYTYDRKSPDAPPFKPSKQVLSGVISTAYSEKAQYRTLTLTGQVNGSTTVASEDISGGSLFYAAKLMPWEAKDQASSVWNPKKDVKDSFDMIFGHLPLEVTSHIQRAAQMSPTIKNSQNASLDYASNDNMANRKGPPHHLDLTPFKVGSIPSIYYIPNYISSREHEQFLSHLKATPETLKTKLPKRTCQEWGGVMCEKCNQSFLADSSVPPWAEKVNEMLLYDGIFTPTTFPNSVRIHEYDQGEGIGPHCDGPIYVPLVAVLSLASTSVMHFYPRRQPYTHEITEHYNDTFKFGDGEIGQQQPIASVVMEPGSLLIFTDEAFTHYPHGVNDRATEDLRAANCINRHLITDPNVMEIVRTYRASVTIRNLLPRCEHSPERNEFMMKRAWHHFHQTPPPPVIWDTTSSLTQTTDLPKEERAHDTTNQRSFVTKADKVAIPDFEKLLTLCRSISETQAQLAKDVADIKHTLDELKSVVGYSFTSSNTFQKEASSVLNHLSMAVMDITNKQEEVADDMRLLQENVSMSPKQTPK